MISVRVIKRGNRRCLVLRWTDLAGRRRERSTKTAKRREAERAARDLEEQLNASSAFGDMPWHEFRKRCEREKYGGARRKTQEAFASMANKLEKYMAPWCLADITTGAISHFAADLRETGMAEQSISSYLARLRTVLVWAHELALIAEVPRFGSAVQRHRIRHMRGRPLTDAEFERMLGATVDVIGEQFAHRWQFYLRGLWSSGLRLEESLLLRWNPDDDDPYILNLNDDHPLMRVWSGTEKGKRDRILPLTPDFVELLRTVPEVARTGYVFVLPLASGTRRRVKTRAVKTVSKKVSAIGKAAGVVVEQHGDDVQYATAHDLRRSFGARLAMKVRPVVLKEMMRHRSLETTMKYYVGESAERTASEVWDAFKGDDVTSGGVKSGDIDQPGTSRRAGE